jgi:DNA-binding Lrp family transcriptional regulator
MIEIINNNPQTTIIELSNLLKITETAVENNIDKLKKLGIIERNWRKKKRFLESD